MRITVLLIFISLVGNHGLKAQGPSSCSCDFPGGEILFCDNFEDYQAGIDLPSQSEDWAGNLGLPTRKRAAGGLQSLSIADQDALVDSARAMLGSHTTGRYRLSWKLFYGNTDKGVFFFRPNGEKSRAANWMFFEDGTGNLFLSPGFWGGAFDLPTGQWNEFVQLIDLEQNLMELWINGAMIHRSSFYSQAFDIFPGLFIGLLEFQKTAPGGFFIDDVCLSRLTCLPEEASSEFSCPLLVNDRSFDHPAAAACAGYTYKEWTVEAFAGFREDRDWTTDGLRVRAFDEAAGVLEVAIPSIDSLLFSPEDILPRECYAGGRVEMERPTFTGTTDCDSLFQVSWIIFDGEIPIDRYDLEVQVKQFSDLEVESFTVFGQSARPGDTLRLFDCFEEIPFDMTASGSCSPDTDSVVLRLLARRRLFTNPRSAAPTEEACSLYELLFSPSQPGCCDGRDFSLFIEVVDQVPPGLTAPPDTAISHLDQLEDPGLHGAGAAVADNCGIAAIKFSDSNVRPATCRIPGLVQRAWTVEDYCGNITRDTQMITVLSSQFVAEAGPDKILDCQHPAVRLEGEIVDGMEDLVVTWSTEDGHIREGDSTLTPMVDRAGLYKLLVTGPDNECSAVDTVRVQRREGLQITLGFTDTLVESGGEQLLLPAADPGGGTWSGPFLSGNFFDIQAAGPGEYELVYTVQIETGCRDSSRLFIMVENTTAVGAGPEAPTLRIFPNPGKEWFVLEMNRLSGDPVLLTLFDVQGQKVLTRRFDPLSPGLRETIDVRDLPPGIYLFSVRERQFHFWRRLIFH